MSLIKVKGFPPCCNRHNNYFSCLNKYWTKKEKETSIFPQIKTTILKRRSFSTPMVIYLKLSFWLEDMGKCFNCLNLNNENHNLINSSPIMRGWNVWIALFTSILKCTFKIEYNSIEMYINIKLPKAIFTIAWVYR